MHRIIFSINHPFTEVISDRMEMLMFAGNNSDFFVSKSKLYVVQLINSIQYGNPENLFNYSDTQK